MAKTTLRLGRPDVAAIIDEKHAAEKDGWRKNRLLAIKLAARGEHTSAEIADLCGIARGHLFRWLAAVRAGGLETEFAVLGGGRQSCLAYLLRTAREIRLVLAEMKTPDTPSVRFCIRLTRLLKLVCAIAIPTGHKAREKLIDRLHRILHSVCANPLTYHKAETLRKRLIPGAREHSEVFTFIRFRGPPTNNHAERALRPLVIFRKVCMGNRSEQGSRNTTIFNSLTETAKLQKSSVLEMFQVLLTVTEAQAQDVLFRNSS